MPGWASVPPQRSTGSALVNAPAERRATVSTWVPTEVQAYQDIPADTAPPVVTFTSPAVGATISGGAVVFTGTAVDANVITGLVFRVGNVTLGSPTMTGSNWSFTANTLALANGNITVTVEATDNSGNSGVQSRAFVVNNVSTNPDVTGAYVQPTYTQLSSSSITGTLITPDDARLTYLGCDGVSDPGTFPGFFRPAFIVGTTGSIPSYSVKFNFSGQTLELFYKTRMNGEEIRVGVNGQWQAQTTTAPYRSTAGSGVDTYLKLDFGSAATRTIRLDLRCWLGGIKVATSGTVTKAADPTFVAVELGDSLAGGTQKGAGDNSGYYTSVSSYWLQAAQTLSWPNAYNESIGGSGFTVNGDGGGAGRYIDRVAAAVNARNPNVVMLGAHILNDQTADRTPTQCRDALVAVLSAIRNALPNTNIICELTPLAPAIIANAGGVALGTALVKSFNDPMRVASATYDAFVIDPLDGKIYGVDGELLGNSEGGRWQMPTDSSGQPGSAYPSDYMTGDGVHPTRAGSWVLAGQTSAAVQMIQDSSAWKGATGETNQPADTTPPVPPTLQTPAVTTTSVSLQWTAATDPSGISAYKVYRSGALQATVTGTTWTQSGLTANTTYGPYEVTAVDNSAALNESSRSNQVSAKTDPAPVDSTAPTVPTALVVNPTDGGFAATWNPSTDAGGMAGYRVYVGGVLKQSVLLTNYTATGLTNGTTVAVQVSAYDMAGNESAKTTAVNVTPAASTSSPDAPTGLAVVPGDGTLRLMWTQPASAKPHHYNIYIGGQLVHTERVTSTIIDELVNGTSYSCRVSAVDASGNEGPLTGAVSDTPYPPSALGAPIEVASFGPNGTHWPDRTPWLYGTFAKTVDVACTWAAIKTAVNALTAADVNAGVRIRVAPGELTGSGASSGSANPMANVGQKSWRKRVLIVPRDGRGTITFNNSVALNKVFNCTFALFDMPQGQAFLFEGCSYSALAWCSLGALRVTGLGGTNTTTGLPSEVHTEGFDVVEVVLPYVVIGDSDPCAWGGGNPGPAGADDGNSWMRFGRFIGGYHAPQYRPVGGFGHNDALQMYGGSGSLYYGLELRDMALWGSTNCAFQLGGWPDNGAAGNTGDVRVGPIRYSTRQKHSLILFAGLGKQVRYPVDTTTTEDPSGSACNGINRPPQHYSVDCVYAGQMYGTQGLKWTQVTRSRISVGPAPSTISGSWTLDTAIMNWPSSTFNRICPVPDVNRLAPIWSSTPPPQSPPVIPAVGATS